MDPNNQSDETVDSIAESFETAGSFPGDDEWAEATRREAVSVAKIDAAETDDPDEAIRKARALNGALGTKAKTGDRKKALDAYRARALELRGGNTELLDDPDVDSERVLPECHPMGSDFYREKRRALDKASSKRNMFERAGDDDRAALWRRRENQIKAAEDSDDIARAMGRMTEAESQQFQSELKKRYRKAMSDPHNTGGTVLGTDE